MLQLTLLLDVTEAIFFFQKKKAAKYVTESNWHTLAFS